jgi:hypothetical protein
MRGEINFYPIPDSNNYNMYDNFQNKKKYFFAVPRNIPVSKSLFKTTYLGIYCLNSVEGTKIGHNLSKNTFY